MVATDAYVQHAQSMSYSSDRRLELAKRSDQLLLQKYDPERDIWPQVNECRDSLAMASVRVRLDGALIGRELIRQGRAKYEGRRIAFILPVAEPGGGSNVVIQESNALRRMGVDVTLAGFEHLHGAPLGLILARLTSVRLQTRKPSRAISCASKTGMTP